MSKLLLTTLALVGCQALNVQTVDVLSLGYTVPMDWLPANDYFSFSAVAKADVKYSTTYAGTTSSKGGKTTE